MTTLVRLSKDIISKRKLIFSLALNDFKTKYAGSYFGVIWAFIQPIMTILVFWFVFQFGLKVTPVENDFPFVLWFMTGLIPWFFFSDSLINSTNCFFDYSYLVKKVVFKISILPLVKIVSSLFIHIVFILFLFSVYLFYGYQINISAIQIFYYSICMVVFVIGLSFITSSIVVFFKDLGQIIAIIMQFGMWLTPIMWSYKIVPAEYKWFFELNPMYYIVEGYRSSLIKHEWFFDNLNQTLQFWFITIIVFLIGIVIFKRLKSHFADVL